MGEEIRKQTAVDRFLDMAEKYPENTAVEDRHGCYSFRQVDEISNLVAEMLVRNLRELLPEDESPEDRERCTHHNVGVIFPRKKEVLPAFLGILRSANCYVFSAPDAPSGRLNYILNDADISCVITTREALAMLKFDKPVRLLFMEDILASYAAGDRADRRYQDARMEDPAYITYTSGSTGNPKGAIDTYFYIDNHVSAWHHYYVPKPGECVGSIVSYSYAASTYDLFSGLTVGANLYIFHEEEMMDQALLDRVVAEKNITSMFMIPSMIPIVFAPGAKLPIRWIITAGEKAKQIPEISAQMAEIYGSSEAAAVLGHVAHPGDPWDFLGKPFPGTELFLLDENGNQIREPGKVGELCIVNDALSLGYLHLTDETNAKFRPCPFLNGRRMYVSGDMMRRDAEGNYYYCGRKDNMTKINGQRVEMGEIESAIVKHPAVEDAVCTVIRRNRTDMLVCYYILKENTPLPTEDELERHTAERLPKHMVPSFFVVLPEFPKNINGKVDRKSLPEVDFEARTENIEPEDYRERKLLEIASRILPDIRFGVTDDLMKLGMDSINAVRFISEAADVEPRLTVSDIMRFHSIRAALTAPKQAGWFYADPDDKKPVMVLIHGIIPLSGLSVLCEMWEPYFNIFVIEPFPDHLMRTIGRCDYNALIAFYIKLLDESLPACAKVWGFSGFSFGGQMAVSMASAWKAKTGQYSHVIMGDTLMQIFRPGKVFPVVTENDPQMKKILQLAKLYGDSAVNEPIEILIKKQNAVVDLLNTIHENVRYDGPVLYLDAKPDYDEQMEVFKLSVVRSLYGNMELVEFPESHHNELYLNRDMESFYRDYFVYAGALDACRETVQAEIRNHRGFFNGTAIECDGRSVSYPEYDRTIERIGVSLAEMGIGPGDFVAVQMPQDERIIMAIFGVLWSGAAVVPINDDIPSERRSFMMEACRVRLVLDEAQYRTFMANGEGNRKGIRRGREAFAGEALRHMARKWAEPGDPAMAIFTSGSTGRPKGICHSQSSVRRTFLQFPCDALSSGIRLAEYENVIGHLQPGYIVTYIFEYPPALLNGKKLLLLTDAERSSAQDFSCVMEQNERCLLAMVPSQIAAHMEDARFCKALRHVSCLLSWAEPVSDALKEHLGKCLEKGSTAVLQYGQTETSGIAWRDFFDPQEGMVLSADVGLMLIKKETPFSGDSGPCAAGAGEEKADDGEKGEICILSPMNFMRYLNSEEDPAGQAGSEELYRLHTIVRDGNRYVRTGDMGRLNGDRLVLLGRGDRMIKFHGLRIELPEIEEVMRAYPEIEAAAAVVCKNTAGISILTGYYVSPDVHQVTPDKLLDYMRPILPEYMIPSAFVRLERMPAGKNGKIDYHSLETRVISPSKGVGDGVKAESEEEPNEGEKLIISKAARLLDMPEDAISPDSELVMLGIDSLRIVLLAGDLEDSGYSLTIGDFVRYRTIRELAKHLKKTDGYSAAAQEDSSEAYETTDLQAGYFKKPLWIVNSFVLNVGLSGEQFLERLNGIGRRHPALRSTFFMENGRCLTRISEWNTLPGSFRDVSGLSPNLLQALINGRRVQLYADKNRETMFYMDAYRTGPDNTVLLLAADHRVMDKFSENILLNEMVCGPDADKENGQDGYVSWLRETHSPKNIEEAETFWSGYLRGSTPACIPVNRSYSGKPDIRSFYVKLDKEQTKKLYERSRVQGVSVPSMVLYQYGLALLELLGEESIFFTGALSGRQFDMPGMDSVVGCIVNSVPLKITRQDSPKSFMDRCLTADAYSFLPQRSIMRAAFGKTVVPVTAPFITSEIFPHMGGSDAIRYFMEPDYRNMPEGNFLWEDAEGLNVAFRFDVDLWDSRFPEELTERMYRGLTL